MAVGFYRFMKVLEYETANPGQDFNDKEAEVFNPDEDTARAADVVRPNVMVGRSEYIVDESGIHRSQDLRETIGGQAPGASGGARAPARYDGEGNLEPNDHGHDSQEIPLADRYRSAPDAENGNLGGNYRVSGL